MLVPIIIAYVFALIFAGIFALIYHEEDDVAAYVFGMIMAPVFFGLYLLTISMTSGLLPSYSSGSHVGYVVELKEEGAIWKTTEGKLQVGVGKQNAAMENWKFSVTDEDIKQNLMSLVGTDIRVVLTYHGWLILPYKMGSANVLITDVKIAELGK